MLRLKLIHFDKRGPSDADIHTYVNWVSNGLGNGLSLVQHWANTWTNAISLWNAPLETNLKKIKVQEMAFK